MYVEFFVPPSFSNKSLLFAVLLFDFNLQLWYLRGHTHNCMRNPRCIYTPWRNQSAACTSDEYCLYQISHDYSILNNIVWLIYFSIAYCTDCESNVYIWVEHVRRTRPGPGTALRSWKSLKALGLACEFILLAIYTCGIFSRFLTRRPQLKTFQTGI